MAANSEHVIELLEKYSAKQASSADVEQLFSLLRSGEYDETVVSFMEHQLQTFEPANAEDIAFWQNRLQGGAQRITGVVPRPVHRMHFLRKWGWAAAAIVIGLGIGVYFWNANIKEPDQPTVAVKPTVVPYGTNGAKLMLDNGEVVDIDSMNNGLIADQNGTRISLKDGALAYDASGSASSKVIHNSVLTPYGRQCQLTLPDGTKVWLNAGSAIYYPTIFTGKERMVSIEGEVYFEVAKNPSMPFIVTIKLPQTSEGSWPRHARLEVLGTHFNVNSYGTDVKTTLLEGSLKVVNEGQAYMKRKETAVILKPGEQSITDGEMKMTIDHSPDLNKAMAWKNGLFIFEGASFNEIMRELERWYDVEIVYEKAAPKIEFEGKLTRDVPLTDLLRMFEKSDIHFRKEGRKLIILSGK
jgi:ferric-dicitrate binding protein FerR (iron transport regulator)